MAMGHGVGFHQIHPCDGSSFRYNFVFSVNAASNFNAERDVCDVAAKPEVVKQLDQAILEYGDKYQSLETLERNFVRTAMLTDRSHFCHFVACLKPVMVRRI